MGLLCAAVLQGSLWLNATSASAFRFFQKHEGGFQWEPPHVFNTLGGQEARVAAGLVTLHLQTGKQPES